jgi:hypothetical protein
MKKICPICKESKRLKCFIFNKIKNKEICKKCNRHIGSNIFYVPFDKRKKAFVGKYSISTEERRRLYSQFIQSGLSPSEAGRRIAYTINGLRMNLFRKKGLKTIKRNRELRKKQKQIEDKKKFIEGLQ